MDKQRTIAVIVRDPAAEALRMATGLTSILENIRVFVVDHVLQSDANVLELIEAMKLMGVRIYSNMDNEGAELISDRQMSVLVSECDIVIPY